MNPEIEGNLKRAAAKMSRREFLRSAALAGIAPMTAGAIFNQAGAQAPVKGGNLVVALAGGATTDVFDPALCTQDTCATVNNMWGTTLTRESADGRTTPLLAESWEPVDGGRRWRFNLRRGVEFHNGKTVTADDVVATLRRHSDKDSKSGALGILTEVEGFRADGKNAVEATLKAVNPDFPLLMSDYHLIIQPDGGGGDESVGAGPYTVEEAEHGVRYLLRKYPTHFNPDMGHVETIEALVINDDTARVSAVQTGQAHMTHRVPPKVARLLSRSPDIQIRNISGRAHYVFPMHCDTPPFDDNDLRLALKLSVNRGEMVEKILQGYGGIGNDFPINAAYGLFPAGVPQREYDPKEAARLYRKSGHSGPIVLRVAENAFPGAVDAATLYKHSAAEAGINIEVKREPSDGYWSNVWNVQPFCVSYWSGRPVQHQMYSIGYKSDADWNDTRFKRTDFDALLARAQSELDESRRAVIYEEMALMVRDHGGVIVPMFNDFIDAIRSNVKGFKPHPGKKLGDDYGPAEVWLEG